jgi:hypothetical protein
VSTAPSAVEHQLDATSANTTPSALQGEDTRTPCGPCSECARVLAGCWTLVAGCWTLVAGRWRLTTHDSRPAEGFSRWVTFSPPWASAP